MQPHLIHSWSQGLEAAAKLLAKLPAGPWGAGVESGNLENPRCHVWAGASVRLHVCVCPSRVSTSSHVEAAGHALAGSSPRQSASVMRILYVPVFQEWPYLCSAIVPNSVPDQIVSAKVTLGTVGTDLTHVQ